jgi:hypothetical protein
MAATDYATLQAEAAKWCGGSSDSNFPQIIRDAISFAETDLDRTLWVPERVKRVSATFTAEYEAIPDDCSKLISIKRMEDGEEAAPLMKRHPEVMPGLACTYRGQLPMFYALVGAQVQIAPKPTTDTPLKVRWIYYGMVPRLSDETSCTAVLTTYPQVYLYTVLKHLAPFADDAAGAAKWGALSDQAILAANRAAVIR